MMMRKGCGMRRMVAGVVVAALLLVTAGAPARGAESRPAEEPMGPGASAGWGLAAVGTNLIYMPVKIVWAITGSVTALLAWGFSAGNGDVALSVLQPTLGGTWVVTPEMLRGNDPILFIGPSYEPKSDDSTRAPSATERPPAEAPTDN